MKEIELALNAFLALLAILNPIGNMPIFVEMTDELDVKTRRKLFDVTVVTGFLTLVILTFTGRWIMEFVFQISIDEFRIAGGILLLVIAVHRIAFTHHNHHEPQKGHLMEMGVVPMAIPLLVGPGAIVTSILILDRDGWLIALISLSVVFAVTWLILRSSSFLNKIMGKFGNLVLSRILYIFIAAIGVHFLTSGVAHYFKIPI